MHADLMMVIAAMLSQLHSLMSRWTQTTWPDRSTSADARTLCGQRQQAGPDLAC